MSGRPKRKTKLRRLQPDEDGQMLEMIGAYLERHGWHALVVGGCSVHQQIDAPKYNFEFVVKFTGKKIEE